LPPGRPATPAPELCVLGLAGDCGGVGCASAGSAKSARLATRELIFAFILALPPSQRCGKNAASQHQFRPRAPLLPWEPSANERDRQPRTSAFLKAEQYTAFRGQQRTIKRPRRRHWPQLQRQRCDDFPYLTHDSACRCARQTPWRPSPPRCRLPTPRTCSAGIRRSVRCAAASPRARRHTGRVAGMGRCAGSRAIAGA